MNGLHRNGVRVAMMHSETLRNVADTVAAGLVIDEVFAEVLPERKAEAVKNLQGRGHSVAIVGDGVDDTAASSQADRFAIGAGTDVAIESAGVVLALGQSARCSCGEAPLQRVLPEDGPEPRLGGRI